MIETVQQGEIRRQRNLFSGNFLAVDAPNLVCKLTAGSQKLWWLTSNSLKSKMADSGHFENA